jgi:hypothetical protein
VYTFICPLYSRKKLKQKIVKILNENRGLVNMVKTFNIFDNFNLSLIPSSNRLNQQYLYGISSDNDSGGFVVQLIYQNLESIIREKEFKVSNYKHKYPVWWLAVVDIIGFGLNELDLNQFNELLNIQTSFDRILLVSPLDSNKYEYLFENNEL